MSFLCQSKDSFVPWTGVYYIVEIELTLIIMKKNRDGDSSSCFGDGGGPVCVLQEEGKWEVVGIQSWGVGCGKKGQPNVATKIEPFLEWIEEILKK